MLRLASLITQSVLGGAGAGTDSGIAVLCHLLVCFFGSGIRALLDRLGDVVGSLPEEEEERRG